MYTHTRLCTRTHKHTHARMNTHTPDCAHVQNTHMCVCVFNHTNRKGHLLYNNHVTAAMHYHQFTNCCNANMPMCCDRMPMCHNRKGHLLYNNHKNAAMHANMPMCCDRMPMCHNRKGHLLYNNHVTAAMHYHQFTNCCNANVLR
jgi:sulfur transfer complex TusBCD TusB component (DsrH family)